MIQESWSDALKANRLAAYAFCVPVVIVPGWSVLRALPFAFCVFESRVMTVDDLKTFHDVFWGFSPVSEKCSL
ncbi:hypothetical protein [Pseudomonas lundensis]|uniref:hypothetical protein n=1 Tax=Pseudomonas lundensis TaxID=86185 RepID=UPI000B18695D|nr:hypothetical protein [Pseudomonas lundensis]NNA22278.1 hypothetical protein [Pseudomonas lundensis]